MSTMTRAQETGNIILSQLDDKKFNIENCSLIEEGAPIPPEPKVGHWKPQNWVIICLPVLIHKFNYPHILAVLC